MGVVFAVVHWVSFIIQILFATVCIASGLFYITEIIEDYTVISRNVFKWSNFAVAIAYVVLFLFEDANWMHLLCGLALCVIGYLVLQQFPTIEMLSPAFIGLILIMVVNHVTAFFFFQDRYMSFSQIIAYFTLLVWLVPLQLILGLVAGENVLPTNMKNSGAQATNKQAPQASYY